MTTAPASRREPGILLGILAFLVSLVAWLLFWPEFLLGWDATAGREDRRWRGFWRR